MPQTHEPRLQLVTGQPFYVKCRHCGGGCNAGDGGQTVADLNGEPWTAYFHRDDLHDCYTHAGEYPAGNGVGFRHNTNR